MNEFEVNYGGDGQYDNDLDLNSPDTTPVPEPEQKPDTKEKEATLEELYELVDQVGSVDGVLASYDVFKLFYKKFCVPRHSRPKYIDGRIYYK